MISSFINFISRLYKKFIMSRLLKNMSWLFILNFSNKIIPFFTFPYITRIFHPEGFGVISFSLAFIAFFQVFIDYGFNLTGVRKVSTIEDNEKELSKVYSTIIFTKFLLFLISIPLIFFITIYNETLSLYKEIIFIFILMALSNVLIPTWLFQGLQRVKDMTIISLSVRIIFLFSVFNFVKSPEDLTLYAILYSSSFLIIGILSMLLINKKIKVKFCEISFRNIIDMLKDGFHVFTSSAVISVMASTGILVLGLFYTAEYSGYYSGIAKINQVITMLFYPIGQALFPYHSKKYKISFEIGYSSVIKITKKIVPIFIAFAIGIILFREQIVWFILGKDFANSADYLIVMSFLPVLSIISNLMGTQILVASGHTKEYSRAFLRGASISVALYFILGYFFAIWGVVIGAVIGEIVSLFLLHIEVRRILKNERKFKL